MTKWCVDFFITVLESFVSEDLHASAKAKDKMEHRLFLDVVVVEDATILELFADQDLYASAKMNKVEH